MRAPAFGVPVTLGTGAAILTCCTAVARLNHRLQAVGRTGPARAVGDTAHVIGADAAVLADFAVDTAAFVTPVYGSSATSGPNALSGLNNAGHAVGWKFELESVTPLLRGVAFPAAFDTLPAGAPRRRPDTGHGFTYTYFVDDADRVYGASEGATFAAASGGAATWLYPYTGNAPLRAVSPGGLLAAGPTAEACTAVGARGCLPAGTLFLWRAADRAVMRVVLPVPWAVELVTGVNDAGQLVGQATDGARHIAVLLTPAAPLPAPGG